MAKLKTKLNTITVTRKKKFVDWACHYAFYIAISVITTNYVTPQSVAL